MPSILDRFSIKARKSINKIEKMSIHQRIRQGRLALEMTEQQFADAVGVSRGSVQQWEREDGTAPKRTLQPAVARVLGLTVAELVDPHGIKAGPVEIEGNPEYPSVKRARFKLQAGADGYAIENDDGNGLPVVFRRDWFELHNYKPERMLAIRVTGSSMEPSLFADDLVIVNLAQDQPKDGNVFAVNYEGEMVIKRMVRDSGEWLLRSDNPDKVRFSDKRCHSGVSVLGEIVYKQSERI